MRPSLYWKLPNFISDFVLLLGPGRAVYAANAALPVPNRALILPSEGLGIN
jgi:hypothetical protein